MPNYGQKRLFLQFHESRSIIRLNVVDHKVKLVDHKVKPSKLHYFILEIPGEKGR